MIISNEMYHVQNLAIINEKHSKNGRSENRSVKGRKRREGNPSLKRLQCTENFTTKVRKHWSELRIKSFNGFTIPTSNYGGKNEMLLIQCHSGDWGPKHCLYSTGQNPRWRRLALCERSASPSWSVNHGTSTLGGAAS